MDNTYGNRALRSMYKMIWNYSTVLVLDSDTEDEANHLFVKVLKNIDTSSLGPLMLRVTGRAI